MQIHDLNTKSLTDPAYVAFDDGTDTYKTEFNEVVANAAASAVADADLTKNTVAFTSGDSASPTGWTAVDVLTSGLSLKTLFNRISTMVKNVRYIWNKIGTASMGTTATTITGAIAEHESDISTLNSKIATGEAYPVNTGFINVSFENPFPSVPTVIVTLVSNSTAMAVPKITNISRSGFSVAVIGTSNNYLNSHITWAAVI